MSDDQILELIRNERTAESGFRALVAEYQERLYWHIRRMVLDHESTDDLLQETFIKVYSNLDKFEGKSSLYTWMYRVCTNECLSYLKKQKRRRQQSLDDQEGVMRTLEADPYFDGDHAQCVLQAALSQLPDKQRLVFQMRYYEEMSYQKMSEVLETSVGALKASFHHAVKKVESFVKTAQY